MPYEIKYDDELKCLMCRMFGKINFNIMPAFAVDLDAFLSKHDCQWLFNDVSEADMCLSTMELYEIPNLVAQYDRIKSCKRAIVIADNMAESQFFEDTSVNRAQNIKIFKDVDEAKQWLFSD